MLERIFSDPNKASTQKTFCTKGKTFCSNLAFLYNVVKKHGVPLT